MAIKHTSMHPRITHLHYEPNEPTIPVGRWSRRSLFCCTYQQIYPKIEQKASVRKKSRNMRSNKYFLKVVPSTTTINPQQTTGTNKDLFYGRHMACMFFMMCWRLYSALAGCWLVGRLATTSTIGPSCSLYLTLGDPHSLFA